MANLSSAAGPGKGPGPAPGTHPRALTNVVVDDGDGPFAEKVFLHTPAIVTDEPDPVYGYEDGPDSRDFYPGEVEPTPVAMVHVNLFLRLELKRAVTRLALANETSEGDEIEKAIEHYLKAQLAAYAARVKGEATAASGASAAA